MESAAARPSDPLLVFADDWGRHPSSCQHLVGRLLDRHPVWWVNTIGMRPPRLDGATLARGAEKVRQWARGGRGRPGPPGGAIAGHPRVLNPRMWPWFRTRLDRALNRELLFRQLTPVVESMPAAPTVVTTIPVVADLIGALPATRWVYYCVDDFGEWPGLDRAAMARMERRLVDRADLIVAASETLRERLARWGRDSHLLTHGVDRELWSGAGTGPAVAGLDALPRPLIVFWGVIDRRMDVGMLRRLDADLGRGTIVLAGPEQGSDPVLSKLPHVTRLGPLPFDRLPRLAQEASVLIMPYADLPVTRAIQPLKLKEYLATGRPTVVSDLPATRPWSDCLDLVTTPEGFSRAVLLRCGTGLPDDQRGSRGRLDRESWGAKATAFESWIVGPGATAPPHRGLAAWARPGRED